MRLLFFLLMPLLLFGSKAMVTLEIENPKELFVSKKFIVTLKVKTTAYSINDLDVNFQNNNDFVIIAPQSAAYLDSEEIGDETYQYSAYEYEVYPLKTKSATLRPWTVSFNVSLGYGQPLQHFKLKTKQKRVYIHAPKGVKGFILSTPKLTIKTSFSTLQKKFKVGDAITQTIETTALDVPDVLIPKIIFPEIEGLKRYEEESRLSQVKGETYLVSKRVQSATYLFLEEGNYTIPRQTLKFYDTDQSKIRYEKSQMFTFEVIAESNTTEAIAPHKRSFNPRVIYLLLVTILSLFLLIFLVRWNKKRVKNRYALQKRMNPK